jgi:hypothetical protein
MFKHINISIANTQQIMINKIIVYIKGNNYFGDKYHEYKEKQIEANNWWKNKFFIENLKDIDNKFLEDKINYNNSELKNFFNTLK